MDPRFFQTTSYGQGFENNYTHHGYSSSNNYYQTYPNTSQPMPRNHANPTGYDMRQQQGNNGWRNTGVQGARPLAKITRWEDDTFLPKTRHGDDNNQGQHHTDAYQHAPDPHPPSWNVPDSSGYSNEYRDANNPIRESSQGENENDRPFHPNDGDDYYGNNNQWDSNERQNSKAFEPEPRPPSQVRPSLSTVSEPPIRFVGR
jgi:hypothetical protein